jgi:hypothetical protein
MSIDRTMLFRLATSTRFERIVKAVPRGEDAAWRAAARYVAGTEVGAAVRVARELHARGMASSIDQFGELVDDPAVAHRVAADYRGLAGELADLPGDAWLSVDLSHLGLDVDPAGCADHLATIARALPPNRRIQVGAEDHARADAVLACVLDVAGAGLADRLGATAQANLRRTPEDVSSRAPTSSRSTGPSRTASRPTSPFCAWRTGSRRRTSPSPSPPTTASSARRSSPRSVPYPSSTCWGFDRTCWRTSPPAGSRFASTYPSAATGSDTGCAASPSHAASERSESGQFVDELREHGRELLDHLPAPQRRHGDRAQVVEADQLLALAVQDRQRPGQPGDDLDLVGEPSRAPVAARNPTRLSA